MYMKTEKYLLLLEDDPDDQFTFTEAIKDNTDVKLIHIANNGQEALDWLKTTITLPDMIFTDINMPKMNGIEFFTEILKSSSTCNIPVVFLSSDSSAIDHIGKMGAKTFIKKEVMIKFYKSSWIM